MADRTCSIDGCVKSRFAKGWCSMHYTRWYRWGDPLIDPPSRRNYCTVDGCEKGVHGRGLCNTHYRRSQRGGTVALRGRNHGDNHHLWAGDEVTYHGMHWRIRTARGVAAAHRCECGKKAAQWAYDYTDPHPKRAPDGRLYSLDVYRYTPMCAKCHKARDVAMRPTR